MDVEPADMVAFAAVVHAGGFTAGARALHSSKQQLSARVGRLEDALGVRLLSRTTRRVRPTGAGAAYYAACSSIVAQIDEANRAARAQQVEAVGTVRVTAPALYARAWLPDLLASFTTAHPKVHVDVAINNRRVDVVAEGFDVAIKVGPLDDSSLTARKLGVARHVLVASPRIARDLTGKPLSHAARVPVVGMFPVETWRVGALSVDVKPTIVVADYDVVVAVAATGAGVARVPAVAAAALVKAKRLRLVFGGDVTGEMPIHAVFATRQFLPLPVRLFIDALVERGVEFPGAQHPRARRDARATQS